MLLRILYAERMKLMRSPVWLAFFVLPILPAFMGTFNYLQNTEILQESWYSLWTQHSLFSCYFFLPSILGVYCSYLFRLEHTNHNWNSLMTLPVPAIFIFLSKLITASVMVIFTQVWVGILFILSGKLAGLRGSVPAELPEWLAYGAIGGIVICGVQLCASLVIRSFSVPVGIAMIGGIGGLAAFSKGYGALFPYSLLSLGMRANNPAGPMGCTPAQFAAGSLSYLIICTVFAVIWLRQKDVTAD
ncbi:MAG: ABC transporter permease [Lachnospiraceae bacterium]